MSTLLDQPATQPSTSPSQRLRVTTAAVRLSIRWLGTRKTLTPEQRELAAESFGAEGQFLSAGKKLLDTKHPAFKSVTAIKSRIISLWKAVSLPYQQRRSEFDALLGTVQDRAQEVKCAADVR